MGRAGLAGDTRVGERRVRMRDRESTSVKLGGVFGTGDCRERGPVRSEAGRTGRRCSGDVQDPGVGERSLPPYLKPLKRHCVVGFKAASITSRGNLRQWRRSVGHGLSVQVPAPLNRGYQRDVPSGLPPGRPASPWLRERVCADVSFRRGFPGTGSGGCNWLHNWAACLRV